MTQEVTERRLCAWSMTYAGAFALGRGEEIVIVVLSDAEAKLQRTGGMKPAEVERACENGTPGGTYRVKIRTAWLITIARKATNLD